MINKLSMENQRTIETVINAIDMAIIFKKNWWRGQPQEFKNLKPKIFRKDYSELLKGLGELDPDGEFETVETFKRLSHTLATNLPAEHDRLKWLILMQHYGAATRLLDWTENVLVGLFFAVSKDFKKNGELWSIYPTELNKKAGIGNQYPLEGSRVLQYLAGEPSHSDPKQLAEKLDLRERPQIPIAFYPTLAFPRMSAQQSTFTIHPKPQAGKSIPEVITKENMLTRYVIPANKKIKILNELELLGINNRTLFQDLEALSRDLNRDFSNPFRKIWGQPDLPKGQKTKKIQKGNTKP